MRRDTNKIYTANPRVRQKTKDVLTGRQEGQCGPVTARFHPEDMGLAEKSSGVPHPHLLPRSSISGRRASMGWGVDGRLLLDSAPRKA